MKVLFVKEVENVAHPGEIKEVSNGFARNFLLPKQIAVAATAGTLKQHEAVIELEKKRIEKADAELRVMAGQLGGVSVTVKGKAGAEGRLYGSITAPEIAAAVREQSGFPVDRRNIHLEEPIRRVGEYQIEIRLRKDLAPKIKVVVEAELA